MPCIMHAHRGGNAVGQSIFSCAIHPLTSDRRTLSAVPLQTLWWRTGTRLTSGCIGHAYLCRTSTIRAAVFPHARLMQRAIKCSHLATESDSMVRPGTSSPSVPKLMTCISTCSNELNGDHVRLEAQVSGGGRGSARLDSRSLLYVAVMAR